MYHYVRQGFPEDFVFLGELRVIWGELAVRAAQQFFFGGRGGRGGQFYVGEPPPPS